MDTQNTQETKYLSIINGPSADLLVDAFRYSYSKEVRIRPSFVFYDLNDKKTIMMLERIVSIEYEDGSGDSYNVTAIVGDGIMKFYYNARLRKGCIPVTL